MTGADAGRRWSSFHLVHAGDRDRLIRRVVAPVALDLLDRGVADGFFFLRYSLGGPHVRLRLRHPVDATEAVEEAVRRRAEAHFARWPSTPWDEGKVDDTNRAILPTDPRGEDRVEVNDSVRRAAFEPETERYGGPERLGRSLEYFQLSSLEVLALLGAASDDGDGDGAGLPDGRRLGLGLAETLRQILGFATDTEDLGALFVALLEYWRQSDSVLVERGDALYERRGAPYRQLVAREAKGLVEAPPVPRLTAAARWLDAAVRPLDAAPRHRLLVSQMHMTANRLGLRAADECYLVRLLERATADVAAEEPDLWERLDHGLVRRASAPVPRLEDLEEIARRAARSTLPEPEPEPELEPEPAVATGSPSR